MSTRLTKKQKGFAKTFLETGNATLAVRKNYDVANDNTAAAIGSENLRKANVQAYIDDRAEKAAIRVVELSNQSENLPVALGASKDILDRAGYVPVHKSESKSLSVNIGAQNMAQNEIEAIREEFEAKLNETFRHLNPLVDPRKSDKE